VSQQSAARGRPAIISDDDLLDVARTVFLERGLDATTADVAEKARVSTSLIFYRYKTKEALFLAVLERELALPPFFETLPKRVGKGRVEDALFDIGMAVVDAMHLCMPLSMIAWSSSKLYKKMQEYMRTQPAREKMMKLVAGYLQREIALGRIAGHEPRVIANAYIGGLIDYVLNQYLLHGTSRPADAPDLVRQLINLLVDGCAPKKRTRSRSSRI
jgi:AcrR family transcriptional regulator